MPESLAVASVVLVYAVTAAGAHAQTVVTAAYWVYAAAHERQGGANVYYDTRLRFVPGPPRRTAGVPRGDASPRSFVIFVRVITRRRHATPAPRLPSAA